ncbi:MAG TPA: glycosyltransferase family 2 protein [Bryobacteraceae bacterium]|nr:glycosyltransferase family 2 protein [Bryobacteraceae bacterium]
MQLSIVTPLYNSAPYLRKFYERIRAAAANLTPDFEIVLVNDGSADDSLEIALSIHEQDYRVRVIDLSRNFGQHKAMMTGLANARGDLVFLIDSDLEEPPELLETFWNTLLPSDADVVYGVQNSRKGHFFERVSGNLFYTLLNLFSNYPIPANVVTARLMRSEYVRSLVQHRDREIFIGGLWAITGFRQLALPVVKSSKGQSTYTLPRKVALLVNSITSFSSLPLLYIFYLGCAIISLAGLGGLYLIVQRLFFGVFLSGWLSVMTSLWFLGGLTIFCIGLIGIYLSKIFMEVKDRPYTVIRKVYERSGGPG